MAERLWQRADTWAGSEFEDSLVMVELELGTYVGLNETAKATWEAIEQPGTVADVVGYLRKRFDVPFEDCASAVAATLDRFGEIGLAVPA